MDLVMAIIICSILLVMLVILIVSIMRDDIVSGAGLGLVSLIVLILLFTKHSTYKEECSETTVPQVVWEKHVAEGNVRPTWNIGDKVVNYVTGKHGEIVGKNCGAEHKWKIRYSNHTSLHDARNLKNVAHPGT